MSGCIPLDPATMQIVSGGIEEQTKQALKNFKAVIEASGSSVDKVVKTTVSYITPPTTSEIITIFQVFLKSMEDFGTVNGIYADFFGSHKPARSLVEVARLPKDVLFEIECIALSA